jgi:hypothetical protein
MNKNLIKIEKKPLFKRLDKDAKACYNIFMFTMDIVNQTDENALKDFPEFVGADGAVVALFFDGTPVGAAQVVFERTGEIETDNIRSGKKSENDFNSGRSGKKLENDFDNGRSGKKLENDFDNGRSGKKIENDLEDIRADFIGNAPKEVRRIKKLSLKKGFDGADIRRFFVRSLVFKLLDGEKWIYSDFQDALLDEIGFLPFENGARCRSDSVVFKKMCGD